MLPSENHGLQQEGYEWRGERKDVRQLLGFQILSQLEAGGVTRSNGPTIEKSLDL